MKRSFLKKIPRRGRALMYLARMRRRRIVRHHSARWWIWGTTVLFVFFQFSLQLSSGAYVAGLMRSFKITAFGAGVIISAYYYIYVLLQMPAGLVVDRYGVRRVLSLGALVCALGLFVMALAPWAWVALLGRLLTGLGTAFAFVGCTTIINRWFPIQHFSSLMAGLELVSMSSTLLLSVSIAHGVSAVGWRHATLWLMGGALLLALLIGVLVQDNPPDAAPVSLPPEKRLWQDAKQILQDGRAWINGLYSGLSYCLLPVFSALWGVPFLQISRHMSMTEASFHANLILLGVATGVILTGALDRTFQVRRILMSLSSLFAAALMLLVLFMPTMSHATLGLSLYFCGVFSSSYMIPYTVGNEIATPTTRGASIGFVNMLSVAVAPLFQMVVGLLLWLLSRHEHYTHHYTLREYQIALSVLPALLIIAAVIAWWVPRKGRQVDLNAVYQHRLEL